MLYGGVNYRLKVNPDNDVYVPWAGRVVFAPQKGNEDIKIQFYQVYLVSISWCWKVVFVLIDCLSRILRLSRERNEVDWSEPT